MTFTGKNVHIQSVVIIRSRSTGRGEAARSSETLVKFYQTTWFHTPEERFPLSAVTAKLSAKENMQSIPISFVSRTQARNVIDLKSDTLPTPPTHFSAA